MSREGWKKTHIVEAKPTIVDNKVTILQQEQGENLMMRKILVQSEKDSKR